jgi:steroid Delta-isomerase
LYAPDVRFVDPFTDVRGREHFKRVTENLNARLKEMRFDDLELVGDEPHFMLSWNCTITARLGLTMQTRGVSEFRSQDGLVTFHQDHWDVLAATTGSIPGVGGIYRRITSKIFGD